jgi:hypothetical protein
MIALLLAEISSLHRYVAAKVISFPPVFNNIKIFLADNSGKQKGLLLPVIILK